MSHPQRQNFLTNLFQSGGHGSGTDARSPTTLSRIIEPLALALLCYVLARPFVHLDSGTLSAIAWPAPAIAVAILWPMQPRRWPVHLLAVFLAIAATGDFTAATWRSDLGFCVLNVLEVALCAWLGRRYVDIDGAIVTTTRLMRFLLLLPLAAIGATSILGATLASDFGHDGWLQEWRTLLVGNGVAVLVLVPAVLAWRSRAADSQRPAEPLIALICSVAVVAILLASAALHVSEQVQRVIVSLLLAATAIYGGLPAAATTVGTAAVVGVGLTLMEFGPYRPENAESAWHLQIDMAGLAILTFFVAVAVRERRQLALRLERGRRMEALGLLAGGVAHDFKNILAAVDGYTEIARDRLPADSAARKPLREVQAASARGYELTEEILLAARRGDRVRETLDLNRIVRESVLLARPLCRNGVVIELEPADEHLGVAAHGGQLVRAILNLSSNASLAARSRVSVRIGRDFAMHEALAIGDAPPGAIAWVDVIDDGPGIPAEHLPHLFEPFFSARKTGGNGLGLAIVAGVACEHRGGIAIATGPGGTRFRLVLPLVSSAPATPPEHADSAEPDAPVAQGERVILIDDDAASRERSEDWLAELGFEPLGYADAREALDEAARSDAAGDAPLVLADPHSLPMDDARFAARLREVAPDARLIVLNKPVERAALARAAASALKDPS
ncbi:MULTISPECIES: ATP-binding protein [unclassified Caballeronia]|jgi:signal transduction histidine kinase/CheY-like chemotaxis protein|uniref:ATP-binding protein n=1 Tax=unclassified Caballeronia TaxID=2646786 RepID=UPI0020295C2B|nr:MULTISPECIES: ATP-binding protein [unclassified Caballeronia]